MSSKLNKRLYTDITRLKLLDRDTAEPRFRLQQSPFTGDEEDDELDNQKQEEYLIVGQIFPKSNIYNERSYSIEMKLTKTFPFEPPEVRFLTPIYHPNVGRDGTS
jgi:ubiquitin-protein ligase